MDDDLNPYSDMWMVGFGPKVKDRSSRSVYIAPKSHARIRTTIPAARK